MTTGILTAGAKGRKGRKRTAIAILAALSITGASVSNLAAAETAHPAHEGQSVSIPAKDIKFVGTGLKTDKGELLAGSAYGNLQLGRHGTFVRMPHGFISPAHTHTEDYFAVVVDGVMANHAPGADVVRLPVGSYWFQKGEEPHVTQCLSKTDCLFFMVQPGKFDFVPAK